MRFDNSILAANIDSSCYEDDSISLIPVSFLRSKGNKNRLDNKMLRICILNCTLGGNNAPQHRIVSTAQYGAKRAKTFTSSSNYNRYFLVADLQNPPYCAALMPRTIAETSSLLKLTQGDTLVGNTFCVYEPNLSLQSLGDSTLILSLANESLLPVASPSAAIFNFLPSSQTSKSRYLFTYKLW